MRNISLRLPQNKLKRIVLVAAGIVFLILGSLAVGIPFYYSIKGRQEEKESLVKQREILEQILVLRQEQKGFEDLLLDKAAQQEIGNRLTALARANQMEIASLEPSEAAGEFFRKQVFALTVNTSFYSLLTFLEQLQGPLTPLMVSQVDITSATGGRPGKGTEGDGLAIRLNLVGYLKEAVQPAASPHQEIQETQA